MGKFKRIQVQDIKTAQKSLDDLPDKNLGKTRVEAAEMLNASIRKALDKGYTIREVSEIIAKDNVSIPIPTIRAKVLPPKESAAKKDDKPKSVSKSAKSAPSPQNDGISRSPYKALLRKRHLCARIGMQNNLKQRSGT